MSKSEFIKVSGWMFIGGALAFITILNSSYDIQNSGSILSAILLAGGMSGLRAAYGERAGHFGRSMLLLGMLGPVLWVVLMLSMGIMHGSGNLIVTQVEEGLWVLLFIGPAVSLLGLTLFGVAALRTKPMSRLNWLPFFAGIWYPVGYTLFSIYDISHKGVFPDQYLPAIVLVIVIQFITLCSLGFTLIEDSSKELATA